MTALVLEMMARGVAIGALAAMAAGFARRQGSSRLAGLLFAFSTIAYAINSSPQLINAIGPLSNVVHFASFGGTGLFWLLIVSVFEDRPVDWRTLSPWIGLTLLGLVGVLTPRPSANAIWIVHNLIEAGFAFHALYVVARSWRGDLVESRRRLRGPFLGVVTVYVLTLSAFEIAESLGVFEPWFRQLGAWSLAAYCVAGAAVFLQARPELFGVANKPQQPLDGLDSGDQIALAKLETLMAEGEVWRREGLTIGALAEAVGVPEHRLRPLINDHLGFRNFAAFVNARRIEAAKVLLRDPDKARLTVAAIAYDLGFGSLGPFNRAFKEATSVTPTEYRRATSQAAPDA
ncbi:MAG: helix-turn-helix transcriptional regulator [Hyphomonadaceae bacterium]|nr:helix-turn-helix transcriptional regulator [Hyphomonadaceae bacterium]